jgi:8-amino-7-oxononanoate synthase
MSGHAERLAEGLAALDRESLRRRRRVIDSPQGAHVEIDGRTVLNFASNDYLGLANHPRLREAAHAAIDAFGVGAGASPLVTGHLRMHQRAEERFAAFTGLPRALLFASGYAANLGILTSLCDRHAGIFADRLNHACLVDGARLSRATFTRYPHLDFAALAAQLAASRAGVKVVATDTVFSMDGDMADVRELLALCERHDAWLVLDDAHGMGVLGASGRGALEHFNVQSPRIVYMATLGKALGGYGAFVAGAPDAVEWLVQRARTLIYSTALPAVAPAAAIAAMDLIDAQPDLVNRLQRRIAEFRAAGGAVGLALTDSTTAIQPLALGDAAWALDASQRLLAQGFLVPAIRPPTVPEGTSRLRVSLSAAHTRDDVERLASVLAATLAS